MSRYKRDMRGHGPEAIDPKWPNGAKIAVQFVLNYEEGGENCLLHDDTSSEAFLSEIVGASAWDGQRHWNMESIYEYGARAGFWRLHRLFTSRSVPVTVYGVATALARSPEQVHAMKEANWEIASHGLKWIEYKDFEPHAESAHIERAKALHEEVTGDAPVGWYTGRSSVNTVDLIARDGSFRYVSDSYADDLPYWYHCSGKEQLVIPYTLDTNDMRFATAQGFNSGDQFYCYLKDSFDALYQEGVEGNAKMLSIGLHCRLIGRPGRVVALKKFIDYIQGFNDVWVARRIDIADHWHEHHPAPDRRNDPIRLSKDGFVAQYGGVFEHSPWIAERAFDDELGPAHNSAIGLHSALVRKFRTASVDEKLGVLKAHPDLAGKLAAADMLTAESKAEQSSAGLDQLTKDELETFTSLNDQYQTKFEFPFIIAVKGLTKNDILDAFTTRINNDRDQEFKTACAQVERIALLRLKDMLP